MKNTEAEKKAYARMRPGLVTAGGFLGDDDRSLADIVQADEEAFGRVGLDFEETARKLEELRDQGGRGLGEPTSVGRLVVTSGDARGVLACPFEDGVFHKNSVEAVDQASGDRLIYSDLSIHLLRAHHFCQGKGCEFRLEPDVMARLLR